MTNIFDIEDNPKPRPPKPQAVRPVKSWTWPKVSRSLWLTVAGLGGIVVGLWLAQPVWRYRVWEQPASPNLNRYPAFYRYDRLTGEVQCWKDADWVRYPR